MEKVEKKIILGLGSNLGDRLQNLKAACLLINQTLGRISNASKIYESKPWGFHSENDFLNTCITLESVLDPLYLLKRIQAIEKELGRVRENKGNYCSRPIDIDILFIENISLNTPELQIPHPLYQERLFVLYPLLDLNETFLSKPPYEAIDELINQCIDEDKPSVFEENWFHSFIVN